MTGLPEQAKKISRAVGRTGSFCSSRSRRKETQALRVCATSIRVTLLHYYHYSLSRSHFLSRLFSFSDTRILLWLYPQLTSRLLANLPFICMLLTLLLIFRRDMSSRGPRILSRLCFNLLPHSLGRNTFLPWIPLMKQLFPRSLPLLQLPMPPQYGEQLQALVSNPALTRRQSLSTHSLCRPLT